MLLINLKTYNTIFYDYRPVSLLLAISKVLEKKLLFILSSCLQYSKLQPNHSTEYSALDLIDRRITQMDQDEIPINIYLDLSRAFDTIDLLILTDKLKYYGINVTQT